MDFTLFFAIFSILGIVYFAVGVAASKDVHTKDDYFLGNRQFGLVSVTLTLIATQVGAGMLVGASDEAYAHGYYGLLYNLGMTIGFLLLGLGAASKMRGFEVTTTAELFEKLYGSRPLRQIASVLSIITLGGILAGQILASRKLIGSFYDNAEIFVLGFWCLVIIYTMFGGLKAVIATDILQVILIFVIFLGALSFIVDINDMTWLKTSTEFTPIDSSRFYGFLLMPILFAFIEQDLAQRFFSAKTKRVAMLSAFFSAAIIMAFSFIPVYLGMKAKILGITAGANQSSLLLIIQQQSNEWVLVFVVCALIAAISSTADSLLCAIGSNVVNDFSKGGHGLGFSRILTLVVGAVSLIVAYSFDSVLGILTQSYELSVACLFIPIIACFMRIRFFSKAAAFSIAAGFLSFLLFRLIPPPIPREVMSLTLSLCGYILGYLWCVLKKESNTVN